MRLNALFALTVFLGAVLLSYGTVSAQSEDKTKDNAPKTADAVVDSAKKGTKAAVGTAKKTTVVVTDSLANAADKTRDTVTASGSAAKTSTQKIGKTTINVTDNVAGEAYEGGRWLTTSTWDGTKWAYKRLWFPNKKQ
ncbi:MAG: hypothetical protein ABI999_01175 [Acidobacteriota bacterium]